MSDCAVIELAAYCGFDFVRIDLEHSLVDNFALANLIRTASLLELPVQVRIAYLGEVTRILDCGVNGIVVPDVTDSDTAKQAVELCKFAPIGKRGMYPKGRGLRFGLDDFGAYYEQANQKTDLIVQIEDKKAIDNIDEILSVDGIDMVASGKADLSQSLGVPTQCSHKRVLEAEDYIVKKALAYKKKPVIMASTRERVDQLAEMGVENIIIGPDTSLLCQSFKDVLQNLKN